MIKWFWDTFLCHHSWVDEKQVTVADDNRIPIGFAFLQKCSKCGKRRIQKVTT